jgi:hypothetical protein
MKRELATTVWRDGDWYVSQIFLVARLILQFQVDFAALFTEWKIARAV